MNSCLSLFQIKIFEDDEIFKTTEDKISIINIVKQILQLDIDLISIFQIKVIVVKKKGNLYQLHCNTYL